MKLKNYLIVFFFLVTGIITNAQDYLELKKMGDKFYRLDQYRKALPFYEKILQVDSSDADVILKAGACYLNRYSKEKALKLLLRYNEKGGTSDNIHYWLGRAYHQNYMFNKAIEEYNAYKKSLPKTDKQRHQDIDKYILQTNNARKFVSSPQNFIIRNL